MSVWAIIVGYFAHALPTRAILIGPFLTIFGGECVLQSTIFALTSALSGEYVERYVISHTLRYSWSNAL